LRRIDHPRRRPFLDEMPRTSARNSASPPRVSDIGNLRDQLADGEILVDQ
jgi:hypothetical protein